MTLYIGRFGVEVAATPYETFEQSGPDQVRASLKLVGTTLKELQALSQNLRGLVGRDEPVYYSDDLWDGQGFFHIDDVSVSNPLTYQTKFWADATIRMTRHGSAQGAVAQLQSFGQNRAFSSGTPQSWIAMPSQADSQQLTGSIANASESRTGPGVYGTSDSVLLFIATSTGLYDSYNSYYIAPQYYYGAMASTLKVDGYTVVGSQVPTIGNTADWLITNGLVKLEPGTTGMFKLTCPNSSPQTAWSSYSMEFSPIYYFSGWAAMGQATTPPTIDTFSVRTNEAHEVCVRFVCTSILPNRLRMNIDVLLRRGSRTVEVTLSCYTNSYGLGMQAHTGTWANGAGAQVMWESSDNADGNRYAMIGDSTRTLNRVVTDGVTTNASTTFTSATAAFTALDKGKIISGTNIPAGTTISSVTNATTVVMSQAATASGSGLTITININRMGTSTGAYVRQVGLCGVVAGSSATGNNTEAELMDQYNAYMREVATFVAP